MHARNRKSSTLIAWHALSPRLLANADWSLSPDAETGIGKSIGYLVPMGLAVATGRIRGVVSTFTLLLQRQILERAYFPDRRPRGPGPHRPRCLGGAAPGLGNFIAPSRVVDLRQAMSDAGAMTRDAAAALPSLMKITCDGTIRSWTERNGPLPSGIQEGRTSAS